MSFISVSDRRSMTNDVKELYLGAEVVSAQRSLGLIWEVKMDTFTFQVCISNKPFTRRGVLATINSLTLNAVTFYCDSKVVLEYISNPNISTCMSTTGFRGFASPQSWNSGGTCLPTITHADDSAWMRHLSKTLWVKRKPKSVRPPTRAAEHFASFHMHWCGCLWPLVHHCQAHKRWWSKEQVLGCSLHMLEYLCSPHRGCRVHGHFFLYKLLEKILCDSRPLQTTVLRLWNQFCWCLQRAAVLQSAKGVGHSKIH